MRHVRIGDATRRNNPRFNFGPQTPRVRCRFSLFFAIFIVRVITGLRRRYFLPAIKLATVIPRIESVFITCYSNDFRQTMRTIKYSEK